MRQIVLDATNDYIVLDEGYAMKFNNSSTYYTDRFVTNVGEGSVVLARIYPLVNGQPGDEFVDEFIVVGKGEEEHGK